MDALCAPSSSRLVTSLRRPNNLGPSLLALSRLVSPACPCVALQFINAHERKQQTSTRPPRPPPSAPAHLQTVLGPSRPRSLDPSARAGQRGTMELVNSWGGLILEKCCITTGSSGPLAPPPALSRLEARGGRARPKWGRIITPPPLLPLVSTDDKCGICIALETPNARSLACSNISARCQLSAGDTFPKGARDAQRAHSRSFSTRNSLLATGDCAAIIRPRRDPPAARLWWAGAELARYLNALALALVTRLLASFISRPNLVARLCTASRRRPATAAAAADNKASRLEQPRGWRTGSAGLMRRAGPRSWKKSTRLKARR